MKVSRKGDLSSGHAGFPARPSTEGASTVFINGIPVNRVGDHWASHSNGTTSHDGVTISGSPDVFVEGKAVARVGDQISCGDTIATGSPDVNVN